MQDIGAFLAEGAATIVEVRVTESWSTVVGVIDTIALEEGAYGVKLAISGGDLLVSGLSPGTITHEILHLGLTPAYPRARLCGGETSDIASSLPPLGMSCRGLLCSSGDLEVRYPVELDADVVLEGSVHLRKDLHARTVDVRAGSLHFDGGSLTADDIIVIGDGVLLNVTSPQPHVIIAGWALQGTFPNISGCAVIGYNSTAVVIEDWLCDQSTEPNQSSGITRSVVPAAELLFMCLFAVW